MSVFSSLMMQNASGGGGGDFTDATALFVNEFSPPDYNAIPWEPLSPIFISINGFSFVEYNVIDGFSIGLPAGNINLRLYASQWGSDALWSIQLENGNIIISPYGSGGSNASPVIFNFNVVAGSIYKLFLE